MYRIALVFLALCAVAIYSVEAEKKKMECDKKPPKGANFTAMAEGEECGKPEYNDDGELCCCKCMGNKKKNGGRGRYCNNAKFKYCPGSPDQKCGPPPADADFRKCKKDEECKGQLREDGKICCSKCSGNKNAPGRGYYCNPKYCPGQSGATTASSDSTTASSSGSTTSATTSGSSTTSAAGSTTSAAGSTTSAAGSTTSAAGSTTSAAGGTTSGSGSSDTTSASDGSSTQAATG